MAVPSPGPQAGNPAGGEMSAPNCSAVQRHGIPRSDRGEFQAPGLDNVPMLKGRRGWARLPGLRLEHNLVWAAGLLELANSGDFAANIWNAVPVPVYAIVFMAIGGTVAAIISICALRDGVKAWRNVKFLRHQRHLLRTQRAQFTGDCYCPQNLDVLLDIVKRELYTESINRWGMDILMGGGAVLISIGTFMAIAGANRKVWLASNILSGYLGNAPIALFGLVNFVWSIYVSLTKRLHSRVATRKLRDTAALSLVKQHCFNVRLFFALNGTSTLVGGIGSMLTPTYWWAYVVLIPIIISSYFCNFWWRTRVGYDRPVLLLPAGMDSRGIVRALEFADETRCVIKKNPETAMAHLTPDSTSLRVVLNSFVEHGLFEPFATRLINSQDICRLLCGDGDRQVEVEVSRLLALSDTEQELIVGVANTFLQEEGLRHFENRARFFAEVLGTFLTMVDEIEEVEVVEEVKPLPRNDGEEITEKEVPLT